MPFYLLSQTHLNAELIAAGIMYASAPKLRQTDITATDWTGFCVQVEAKCPYKLTNDGQKVVGAV